MVVLVSYSFTYGEAVPQRVLHHVKDRRLVRLLRACSIVVTTGGFVTRGFWFSFGIFTRRAIHVRNWGFDRLYMFLSGGPKGGTVPQPDVSAAVNWDQ